MRRSGWMLLTLLVLLVTAACGAKETANPAPPKAAEGAKLEGVPEGVQGNIRVAVIRNLPSDDHTKQFLDGARSEGEAFGFKVDTFIAENDDAKFQDLVAQAIQKDYAGLIISHGKKDYSYDMIKPALDKGMKVVTFDTIIDKNGETLPGVTTTFQNDHMLAALSLEALIDAFPDRKPARVIKLWFGGVPPLDRREEIYKKYEEDGKIQTVETIGPTNFQDVQGDIANKVGAVLAKYPPGSVDAIWASWDEMAKGAYKALQEAGRKDIKLISIDISNQDINLMREPGSPWVATAAVDPKVIGIMDMRLLAKKLAGEPTPDTYELEPKLIRKEQLKPDTNMTNLKDVVPGWGQADDFNEAWMETLREHFGKR
ncbi:sugar ABC transporter substrate-binding protein [Hydrogenibacillus schlegelii]|uniref:ABC transporter substrate-binding protein n=2 Tax=Bacillales Family X. Incertae Sedis TaxID=539003 RepID=A0A132N9K6_HYDSH|nr:ABC transporter substrate-binding protein [Hydrogenibacillus schlegelii]MBT9281245.1 sugar ABC transporter substrate-binding protein [Hydrogenibacillus schlegelii]OAR03545.1 ABC transporter substrate-binding protein [Hydrogenibacillus schlegelii]QZA32760.1 sugar ABC transporter substrate-binding protein [Hydrogenibacillus sp. N12]